MHNIGFLFNGSDAETWSGYLAEIVEKSRVKLTIQCLDVQSVQTAEELQNFIKESLVVVLLLSPSMCETLEEESDQYSCFLSKHTAVVVIMCFTETEDFSQFSEQCPASKSWKMLHTAKSKEENRLMMSEVVEMVDQRKHRPPPRPAKRQSPVKVFPNKVHMIKEAITLVFPVETIGTIQVGFSNADTLYDTERLNPYTYQFRAPVRECGVVKLKIYKDGREIYECPLVYVAPDISAYQCTCLLAQSLGVREGGKQALDAKLVEVYEKTFPSDDILDKMMQNATIKSTVTKSESEIPTILHFAAKNGLAEFCGVILDTPGSMALFQTENKDGKNPADLADDEGFYELADYIRMFIETAVVVQACDDYYLQMNNTHIYSNKEGDEEDLDDYEKFPDLKGLLPKPMSFKKKDPLSPTSSPASQSSPVIPRKPVIVGSRPQQPEPDETETCDEESLYSHRDSLISPKGETEAPPPLPGRSSSLPETDDISIRQSPAEFMGMKGQPPIPARKPTLHSDDQMSRSAPSSVLEGKMEPKDDSSGGSFSQKELIDMAESFKSGEFSMGEVERLFSAWKERNASESTSIKERRKFIESMRVEYKSLFEASKKKDNDFGRLSVFGKIKRWHKRKKSSPEIKVTKPVGRGSRYTKFPGSQTSIPEDTVSTSSAISSDSRCSTLSSSSSSSSGSRDSRLSCVSRESSIGECSESDSDSDGICNTERGDSGLESDGQVRGSMKMDFIHSVDNMPAAEPPPIPPRPGRIS